MNPAAALATFYIFAPGMAFAAFWLVSSDETPVRCPPDPSRGRLN
jgi:hypothetical protein